MNGPYDHSERTDITANGGASLRSIPFVPGDEFADFHIVVAQF
ncbi:MAG TPA: hypothetical protein VKH14_10845 [Candidatus Udaeobacter sp.]|nr:hypothetical protein [Candidatus Udaeobacter sp.]